MAKEDDAYIRFRCKACGQKLKSKKTREGGEVVMCPKCGSPVNVPIGNVEAIAMGSDMEETGQPGRLHVDPDLLMKRLRGEGEKAQGPGSVGGAPTLREGGWAGGATFARIQELDQLVSAAAKIDNEFMGEMQRIFRERDTKPAEREERVREAVEQRREDLGDLVQNRLAAIRHKMMPMESKRERLNVSELNHLEHLKRAREAIALYARHALNLDL